MDVQLIKEDMQGNYFDNEDCPLARALKRAGHTNIHVSGHKVDFDDYKNVIIINSMELVLAAEDEEPIIIKLDIDK